MIIGLTGRKRHGKDTVGEILARKYTFERVSFADPLKRGLKVMLDLSEREVNGELKETPIGWLDGITPRYLMQTLGTEWGRKRVAKHLWTTLAGHRIHALDNSGTPVVVTDVRFEDEAGMIRHLGGIVLHIERPEKLSRWERFKRFIGLEHKSERGVNRHILDYIIQNDGTIADLEEKVCALVRSLYADL